MSEQLAYALITPYSLLKSRTGGIIARLLAHTEVDFVGARMYSFSDAFVDEYEKIVAGSSMPADMEAAWLDYVNNSLRPNNKWRIRPRAMLLLFRGDNAVRHLKEDVIGSFTDQPMGDTIRGTYGDLIRDASGTIQYFEPAVITCPDPHLNDRHLELFARYAESDGGILEGRVQYEAPNVECSLVMLKPDNFYRRSRRPGNIIDTFSLTGLRIVAAKLLRMTVAQGEEFYGPLEGIFVEKLKFLVERQVMDRLGNAFDFPFTADDARVMGDHLAARNARCEFNKIVEYMSGVDPDSIPAEEKPTASKTRCLALLYEGPDAIGKIRKALGATDPDKAEAGTVRSDFARDLMRNGAHASDSQDNALRERRIIGLDRPEPVGESDIARLVGEYLGQRA